jgi:methyltransferase (TIGR00027 family)
MEESRPSRTALRVAMRRAAHQLVDAPPKILDDPLAVKILSPKTQAELTEESSFMPAVAAKYMRAFMVVRSRFAEDELARAIQRGASQYVILGAGLDTFAYRNPYAESSLRVFEVDFPATQVWKRERLAAAEIAIPPSLTFAPVDFERQTLAEGLREAGFDARKITFFSWLGVIMYLTRESAISTLKFVAATRPGGGVVFDYALRRESLNFFQRIALDRLMSRVAAAGEPFRLFFDPAELAAELRAMGFTDLNDLGIQEINGRYFANRADGLRAGGGLGRLISARIP